MRIQSYELQGTLKKILNLVKPHLDPNYNYDGLALSTYLYGIKKMLKKFFDNEYIKLLSKGPNDYNEYNLKQTAPELFLSKPKLLLYGFCSMAYESDKDKAKESKVNRRNINLVQHLNKLINDYLLRAGFMRIHNHKYILTTIGYKLVTEPHITLGRYFRQSRNADFCTYVPLSDIYTPAFKLMHFIYSHKKFNHCYGIAYLLGMINNRVFNEINTVEVDGQKEKLGMNWSASMMIYIILLDGIIFGYNTDFFSESIESFIIQLAHEDKKLNDLTK